MVKYGKIHILTNQKHNNMTEKNKISEFITFPTTFENYKWYKPILVFIVTAIMYLILKKVLILT